MFIIKNCVINIYDDFTKEITFQQVKRISREVAAAAATSANGDCGAAEDKPVKQEAADEEISEEQMEADLMKEGDTDIEQAADTTNPGEDDDKTARSKITMITTTQLDAIAEKLTEWKRLAAKLGFKADEIEFFETENATEPARAKNMLQLWFDDDEDASVENLLYIMEGLQLNEAVEALRNAN